MLTCALTVIAACSTSRASSTLCDETTPCADPALTFCVAGACQECNGRPDSCSVERPACSADLTCEACTVDSDCAAFSGTERCGAEGACVACADSTQCEGTTPTCDVDTHACRACAGNQDCASGVCTNEGACLAESAILYAAEPGVGGSSCTQASPCSLATALGLVELGRETILLADGTYGDAITIAGPVSVVLVGNGAIVTSSSAAAPAINVSNLASLTLRGLVLDAPGTSVACSANAAVRVEDCVAVVHSGRAITGNSCDIKIRRSEIRGAITIGATGVEERNGGKLDIDRSKFFGLSRAVQLENAELRITSSLFSSLATGQSVQVGYLGGVVRPRYIGFNTFVDAVLGCPATGDTTDNTITSNIFFDSTGANAMLAPGTRCAVTNNLIEPALRNPTGTGNISGDPRLVDVANGDYHLRLDSPAVDAALDDDTVTTDLDGAPRPVGARSDIGAFELQP